MSSVEVYFSLGSNLGDKKGNLNKAIEGLEDFLSIPASGISEFIITEPWGFVARDKFLNAVVRFEIPNVGQNPDLFCLSLLNACKSIEKQMGRIEMPLYDKENNRQYFSRIIDIDILFYGNYTINNALLTIPHKLMSERDFVMIPLRQIVNKKLISAFPEIF